MAIEGQGGGEGKPPELPALPEGEDDDPGAEVPPSVAAAVGQLALALLVVVVLIMIFMVSSAALRWLFG
jgi:hypothetical protein